MTKTITIPISKETCSTIKNYTQWFIWFGLFALAAYGFVYVWYDIGNYNAVDRFGIGILSIIAMIVVTIVSLWYLYITDRWIAIKCNCEKENEN